MTRGAVSLTKGEGAGRQAGPAAASVISMAAPMRRSGAPRRRLSLRPMVSAARRCGAMSGAAGASAAVRRRRRSQSSGERQEPEEDERAEEAEGGERGHAGASRRRRRAAARVAA